MAIVIEDRRSFFNQRRLFMSKTKGFLLAVGIVLAMAFTFSCSSGNNTEQSSESSSSLWDGISSSSSKDINGISSSSGGGFSSSVGGDSSSSSDGKVQKSSDSNCTLEVLSNESVTCGGQTYRTVKIGNQIWFAENLNYATEGSKCNNNLDSNCDIYGRLYNWATARIVCPSGWHLPSNDEWRTLLNYVEKDSNYSNYDAAMLKTTSGWEYDNNGTDDYGFSALPGAAGGESGSFSEPGGLGIWWSATEQFYDYAYFMRITSMENRATRDFNLKSYLFSVRCIHN